MGEKVAIFSAGFHIGILLSLTIILLLLNDCV